jgi:hypothetical protein
MKTTILKVYQYIVAAYALGFIKQIELSSLECDEFSSIKITIEGSGTPVMVFFKNCEQEENGVFPLRLAGSGDSWAVDMLNPMNGEFIAECDDYERGFILSDYNA